MSADTSSRVTDVSGFRNPGHIAIYAGAVGTRRAAGFRSVKSRNAGRLTVSYDVLGLGLFITAAVGWAVWGFKLDFIERQALRHGFSADYYLRAGTRSPNIEIQRAEF